jgi:serine/threonine protein kinase
MVHVKVYNVGMQECSSESIQASFKYIWIQTLWDQGFDSIEPKDQEDCKDNGQPISSKMKLTEGSVVKGTYLVERYIGSGSFGDVYRVYQKFLHRREAMKIFQECVISESEIVELLHEAMLLSKLDHPNIIRVYDANVLDEAQGSHGYFTMEYIPGGTLEDHMNKRYLVPQEEALKIIRQTCAGVAAAHNFNPRIIHRDLKPANILVDFEENGFTIKVSDFGLAEVVKETGMARAAGSLLYEPPEAFCESPPYQGIASFPGDVFAIGIIFYQMLTGRLPFKVREDFDPKNTVHLKDLLVESRKCKPPDPSTVNDCIDPLIDVIVQKALEFDSQNRFGDAKEMHDAVVACEKKIKEYHQPASGVKLMSKSQVKIKSTNLANLYLEKALVLSKQYYTLQEAIDCLQKAFIIDPSLRDKYVHLLKIWKKGTVI